MTKGPKPRPVLDRLSARVVVDELGHVRWSGRIDRDGYARYNGHALGTLVHRIVYAAVNGPIPSGLEVDHICGERDCVHPGHLRLLTPDQNKRNRKIDPKNKSGYPGVYWHERDQVWVACTWRNGRSIYLGRHSTALDAYNAWRDWTRENNPHVRPELMQLA